MNKQCSFLRLKRLRITHARGFAYDQVFHEGVNIIRGQNGSGKSTIADFIFFALGGEFDNWKDAASHCDQVQAEIETPRGKVTLMRRIAGTLEPILVFFGPMKTAMKTTMEGWERYNIRRHGRKESFSQIMFRSLRIPEAQSEGASNLTMHQILRLCYSDQSTPATRLFRFETFDTHNIREAVGDLVCGIGGYEIYEIGLQLREKRKKLDEIKAGLNGLLKALLPDETIITPTNIQAEIKKLRQEATVLQTEIKDVDKHIEPRVMKEHLSARRVFWASIGKQREKLKQLESNVANLSFEWREISDYLEYLQEVMEKLSFTEATSATIGSIEFTHCPACGIELNSLVDAHNCIVCKSPINMEREKGRYNQIRLDLEIQARESRQLLSQKESEIKLNKRELRMLSRKHQQDLTRFELKFGGGNGPREAFLAERANRLGHIDAEIIFLLRNVDIAEEIELLSEKKKTLLIEIEKLSERRILIQKRAEKRRSVALSKMSRLSAEILRADMSRQSEFKVAEKVNFDFRNDSILVDGLLNFAESSNVFLKNTAILGMFLAAGEDEQFFHPRFALIDNVEDKGMELERSHLFQRIIVERVTQLNTPYQVIFTTSMMNPDLEHEDYTIGPAYTNKQRTLVLE